MPFKVGDTVCPVRPENPDGNKVVAWVSEMNELVGVAGTVEKVEVVNGTELVEVRHQLPFRDSDTYYFLPEWLSSSDPAQPLDVGDFVHFRRPNTLPFDPPGRGRVIGVGERKLAVWPDFYSASEPWFIDRDWVVLEDSAATQTA